ncbi:MAG: bifunctional demethylmenaquinone methyltransferase/2-methoxy-6-polyprenyl-1,4-benzoquinol methylase UbiE [Magnetococcales bacterium]|nr:bifunctional demethylmenaquinone methyltransferase/2-methoxy-6-polyprenyl-1,4-benzoquinol methylase UbiE [Magnetococcales bacterium]
MVEETTHFGFSEIPAAQKVERVRQVFDSVAQSYDLMNDLMSMGVHRLWKRYAVARLHIKPGDKILDVAGGTGDLTKLMAERLEQQGTFAVCDINASMLEVGRTRLADLGMVSGFHWIQGNAETLPFPDHTFHAATIGFGIRNVTRMDLALKEMTRVLRPGGQFLCLEFSHVVLPFLKPIYDAYSFKILPEIGERVAKDRDSYQYLVESIRRFPEQERFKEMMEQAGLSRVKYYNLSAGIAAVHVGVKL